MLSNLTDAGSRQGFDQSVRSSRSADKKGAQVRLNTSISLVHSPLSFYLVAWHYDNRKTDFRLYIDDAVLLLLC